MVVMTAKAQAANTSEVSFLIGPAGSGKTRRLIDELISCEAAGRSAFYLVPEQSTYVADRQILEPPGPAAIRHVRALSFRRLGWLIEDKAGGAAARRGAALSASGRRILLRSLFARLDPRLREPFAGIFDRTGFIDSLAAVLRELRFEGGPGVDAWFERVGRSADLPADLRAKVETIAALRTAYERALAERGLRDPEMVLQETPARIGARSDLFPGMPILVDGFMSFTRLESEILVALTRAGTLVRISLCLDPDLLEIADRIRPAPPAVRIREWPQGILALVRRPVFLATLRTYCELRDRFRDSGIATRWDPVAPAGAIPPRFADSSDLVRLESSLLRRAGAAPSPARATAVVHDAPADVSLVAARDPSHEVETWARQIDRWIRLEKPPVRPGEIAVIVRDLEMYRPLVEETFARFHIPVFVDRHWEIGSRPLVRTVLDALDVLLSGWQRESVIAFLGSPILGTRRGEVDILENLSLEAGLDYERWTGVAWTPLRRPPRTRYSRARDVDRPDAEPPDGDIDSGFGAETTEGEETDDVSRGPQDARDDRIEQARVAIANRLRDGFLEPLKAFEREWTAGEEGRAGVASAIPGPAAIAALRRWIAAAGLVERALAREGPATLRPGVTESDAAREIAAFENVCDSVAAETAGEHLTIESFARLLQAGLGTLKLGRTPTGLDRVTIAEVQRSRVGEVRRAIVGGLSARDFPRASTAGRFFNEKERDRLAAAGLDLGAPATMRQEEEAYFLYIALTRAATKILLTRPTVDLEGSALEASPFIKEIRKSFPGLVERMPSPEDAPADLGDVQTADDLAARVAAYIAARLDRRRSGRGRDLDPERAQPQDRRILSAYNDLITPETIERRLLWQSSRLWGYDNRPVLPGPLAMTALGGKGRIAASAGRLEAFARCPYQHFARHMLRLRQRPRAEITPIENGLLAHRALEVLYKEALPPTAPAEIRRRLESAFAAIERDERLQAYRSDPSGDFRWRNARGQLLRFLEVEGKRIAASPFRPRFFEQEFGTMAVPPLRIPLPDGGEVLLRGRIDRIDIAEPIGTAEGAREALILDYKSSLTSGRGRPSDVEEGLDLQLVVYLLVAQEILGLNPIGALYVPVLPRPQSKRSSDPHNPLDIKMIGLLPEDMKDRVSGGMRVIQGARTKLRDREELAALLSRARRTIGSYASAILRGTIDVRPVRASGRNPCDRCEFAALCRVDRAYNPLAKSPIVRAE